MTCSRFELRERGRKCGVIGVKPALREQLQCVGLGIERLEDAPEIASIMYEAID